MTDPTTDDTPPGVRVLTDGGTDRTPGADAATVKTATVKADGVTTAEIDGEEREVLRVPISSTRPDRENDRFSRDALEGMADQIRAEQPHVFDNHGLAGSWMEAIPYDSRETIGTQFDAEVEEADDGEADLFALVNPDGTHPEGERMLKQVRDEAQAIKFSVGFGIKDEEPIEDEAGNEVGREFLSADLMETSRVGIPANPDASLAVGAKSGGGVAPGFAMHPLFRAMFDPEGERTAAKDGRTPEDVLSDATRVEGDDGITEEDLSPETDYLLQTLRSEREALRSQVDALRADLEDLKDGDDGDTKGPCDDNGDCPEGEVCVDGECVPEDEVDDDESADADLPESYRDLREDYEDLQKELDAVRDELSDGTGDSKTADPTTEDPDLTDADGEPDATDDDTDPDATQDADDETAAGWLPE